MFESIAVKALAALVGALMLLGIGAYGGYRYESAQWKADTAERDLAAEKQKAAADAQNAANAAETKKVNDEALDIQRSQSAYIADFLRKPAPVHSSPVPSSAPGPASPPATADGPGSGPDHPAPAQPFAFQDPDVTAVALAGWEQLRLWRQWCHDTPGCTGPVIAIP
jgi:hypothetical protein